MTLNFSLEGASLAALLVGLASMLVYLVRRRWFDALLVLVGGVALAGACGSFSLVEQSGVRPLQLEGDGLRAAELDDLPARPLAWQAPATPTLRLDFPAEVALGRVFTLALTPSWQAPGRLQLLAENGQVLAEAKGEGPLAVQWLPPLAERLVLRARLLDAKGRIVDQGPVPLTVRAPLALQVHGRFGAPSFDLRSLNELLASSNAVIDWEVELGKNLRRSETARADNASPDLEIVDAAWFERAGDSARASLLARVAAGRPLLVLGANASDAGIWSRSVKLQLVPQAADKTIGAPLRMASGGLNPAADRAGEWQGKDGLWTRDWQRGRIAWLGVGGWHRYAIEEPRLLALWWQDVLDRLRVRREEDFTWPAPDELPLPNRRLAVCARGDALLGQRELAFPELRQTLAWQPRAEQVDASCAAVWPRRAGWLRVQSRGAGRSIDGAVYVYDDKDWPLWQRAQRREAMARYAARTPGQAGQHSQDTRPVPAWPFGLVFMLAMLGLWWRERR